MKVGGSDPGRGNYSVSYIALTTSYVAIQCQSCTATASDRTQPLETLTTITAEITATSIIPLWSYRAYNLCQFIEMIVHRVGKKRSQ